MLFPRHGGGEGMGASGAGHPNPSMPPSAHRALQATEPLAPPHRPARRRTSRTGGQGVIAPFAPFPGRKNMAHTETRAHRWIGGVLRGTWRGLYVYFKNFLKKIWRSQKPRVYAPGWTKTPLCAICATDLEGSLRTRAPAHAHAHAHWLEKKVAQMAQAVYCSRFP